MKWYTLCALIISASCWASVPTKSEKMATDLAIDKVTCPTGYQLIDGTYRIVKGSEGPQTAYARGNTLVVKYKKPLQVQAIAVCARIPL